MFSLFSAFGEIALVICRNKLRNDLEELGKKKDSKKKEVKVSTSLPHCSVRENRLLNLAFTEEIKNTSTQMF